MSESFEMLKYRLGFEDAFPHVRNALCIRKYG
jgi:hypothetical protein